MTRKSPDRARPTIRDVARLAGVSTATVSRVLNEPGLVTETTRKKVEAAATKANFTVSWHARSLASGRADSIAMVVTEPFEDMWSDPTFARVLAGAWTELSSTPLVPMLAQASTPQEQSKVWRLADHRSFDAVIHLTPYVDDGLLDHLATRKFPTVLCGRLPGDPWSEAFSSVYADDVVGGAIAAEHLRGLGRRRPAAIMGPADNPACADRLSGYRSVWGDVIGEERVRHGGWDEHSGMILTKDLLERGLEIDALLCGSDRLAAGALLALQQHGRSVPADVAVVGFDDHALAATSTPPLTTVAQPLVAQGSTAVRLALEMVGGGRPRTVVLPMELVVRASA